MEPVTKNRSLISIIIFLLLSNIAILVFFLFLNGSKNNSHGRDNKNSISVFLKKEIGFNDQQMNAYQKLKDEHMKVAKPLFEQIHSAKDSFYNLLYTDQQPDSVINKAAAVIGEKQMSLDMQMFQHLKTVRNLCTPEELPKFDSLFKNVVQRMTGGRFKKPDNNKNH